MRVDLLGITVCLAAVLVLAGSGPVRADDYQNLPFTCVSGDCQSGMGVAQWPDGARYEGAFAVGQRHGRGTMTWPGGDRYAGEWERGVQHGHGTMSWATGARYIGQWDQGERTGAGSLIYASGKRIDGYFKDGRLVEAVRITDPLAAKLESKPAPKPKPKSDEPEPAAPSTAADPPPPATPTATPPATLPPSGAIKPAAQEATPPAAGDVAAILVEISSQGVVRFVNLYMGPSLAEVRKTMAGQGLPPGFTGREVQSYQGPAHWVAQYGTYDNGGSGRFCYAAALDCESREACEARVRQAWAQAGCVKRDGTEGFSAYNDGAYHGLLSSGFPQVRTFH